MTHAVHAGLIEMTLPHKPRSRLQRYRLTAIGRQWLAARSGVSLEATIKEQP